MVSVKQKKQFDDKLSGLFMVVSYYELILRMMASAKFVFPANHPIVHVYLQSQENPTLKSLLNKKINTSIGKWIQNKVDGNIVAKNIEGGIAKVNDKIEAIVKKRNLT